MRLRLVQCILDSTPPNRFGSPDQLPHLFQSWVSLVSLTRLPTQKLGEAAWPLHDVARRVFSTGVWLGMPGRKYQHKVSEYESAEMGADGLVLAFYTYLCTKLMTEYNCPVEAVDGLLCTALDRVLSTDAKGKVSTPSASSFDQASLINHAKQKHASIQASLELDVERLIALQEGTGRDATRKQQDELLIHCLNLGRMYHSLKQQKHASVQEQKQPRVWKFARARSVSSGAVRKLLLGDCDNQYAVAEYDSFVEGKGSAKQDLEIIEILNTPADAVMAALSHPHSGHVVHLPDVRLFQIPLREGGFNTLLVMKRSLRFGFSRWGAAQVIRASSQQQQQQGFVPYAFAPLLLQMMFSSNNNSSETGGLVFGFACLRDMCGLNPAVEPSWTPERIEGLFKDIFDIFVTSAGQDGDIDFIQAAALLPFFLAVQTEDILTFDSSQKIEDEQLYSIILGAGATNKAHSAWMEAARYLGATPELNKLAGKFQYKNSVIGRFVSFDKDLEARCNPIEDEKLHAGHRFGSYELKEQARNAKATGNPSYTKPCDMDARDQFWWQVLAIIEQQSLQQQQQQKEMIRFPVSSFLSGAHPSHHVCIHQHDVPVGKMVSPNTGTSFVYLDQHFPVWSLSWERNPDLDIGHRARHILERFKSKVHVNNVGPVERMQTTNKKRKEVPTSTTTTTEEDPSSLPPPLKKQKAATATPKRNASSSSSSSTTTTHISINGPIHIAHGSTTTTLTRMATDDDDDEEEGESEDKSFFPDAQHMTPEDYLGNKFSQFGSMAHH